MDVKLSEDAVALDAVVAIGYGTVKQKDLTTAVSIVKTDDLARRPITSASGALQGTAAGVQVIQPNGSPGQGMVVRVRGASSISSSNDPLYVVDGVPVGEGNYAIAYLSPNEIESMQVPRRPPSTVRAPLTAWCSSPPSRAAGRWDPRSRSRPSSASRR